MHFEGVTGMQLTRNAADKIHNRMLDVAQVESIVDSD